MRLQFHPQPAPHLWISQQARRVSPIDGAESGSVPGILQRNSTWNPAISAHVPSPAHAYPQREVRDAGLSGATQSARRHALPLPGALPRPPSASFIHKPVARCHPAPGARVQLLLACAQQGRAAAPHPVSTAAHHYDSRSKKNAPVSGGVFQSRHDLVLQYYCTKPIFFI